MRYFTILLFLFGLNSAQAQIPIGQWRCHLSYMDGISMAEAGDRIYCATKTGLFFVNNETFEVKGLCTVDGFSDIYATTLYFDPSSNILFIGYRGGNIDVVKGTTIINHPEFMNGPIQGLKEINSFYVNNNICYLATTVGIVEYRIKKDEFGDSYLSIGPIGQQIGINMVTTIGDSIYASSAYGVQRAPLGVLLQDYTKWSWISTDSCGPLVSFAGRVWGAFKGGTVKYWNGSSWITYYTAPGGKIRSITLNHGKLLIADETKLVLVSDDLLYRTFNSNDQNSAIMDKHGEFWVAKNIYSMIRLVPDKNTVGFYRPNGPTSEISNYLTCYDNKVFVSPGGVSDLGGPNYNNNGFYSFQDEGWRMYDASTVQGWPEVRDIMAVVQDPLGHHIWASSLDSGLMEIYNDKVLNVYAGPNTNGVLQPQATDPGKQYAPVLGLALDTNSNLWMSVYRAKNQLAVRTATGKWYSFSLGDHNWATRLVADDYNQVWVINHSQNRNMYVFNYGNSIADPSDDKSKLLSEAKGNGALPNNTVLSIAKDRSGEIWIGTADGVAVFSDPSSVFNTSGYSFDAVRPWVKSGNDGGYLLMGENITAIAVDGANRKWFGTHKGVWLTSEDGTRIISHFDVDNSPLISNEIKSITVNGESGEVFFGTDKGLVSYRGTATDGGDTHDKVYAYPNPVKPGYEGPIAIRGLVTDANVKITDITGALVYETVAEGGQAIWYGKNFSGVPAQSGVYLVFGTNADGSETMITKIMIIR